MACPSFYIKIIESADRKKNVAVQEISDPLVSTGGGGGEMPEQVSLWRSFDDCKITDTVSEPQILPRCILEGYGKTVFWPFVGVHAENISSIQKYRK